MPNGGEHTEITARPRRKKGMHRTYKRTWAPWARCRGTLPRSFRLAPSDLPLQHGSSISLRLCSGSVASFQIERGIGTRMGSQRGKDRFCRSADLPPPLSLLLLCRLVVIIIVVFYHRPAIFLDENSPAIAMPKLNSKTHAFKHSKLSFKMSSKIWTNLIREIYLIYYSLNYMVI